MATRKDGEFYKSIDETKGKCFGHEVPADRDTDEYPTKAFQPKKNKQ